MAVSGGVTAKVDVTVSVTFTVTEAEARALDALAGYGDDSAVAAFYKYCGSSYMRPYEQGLRSFLSSIRKVVTPALNEADRLRSVMSKVEGLRSRVEASVGLRGVASKVDDLQNRVEGHTQ